MSSLVVGGRSVVGSGDARLHALKRMLDAVASEYGGAVGVADPVHVLSRFPDPADREIAAFVAAGLAFGRVQSILASIDAVLDVAGPRPSTFVRGFSAHRDGARLAPIVHRWTRGEDLTALFLVLQRMLREAGSIEAFFARGLAPGAPDVAEAIESFAERAHGIDVSMAYRQRVARPGVRYFFARPSTGGACKRMNLFLRWMVRHDAIDPGGWSAVSPSQLIVPLDVHVVRVGQCLRLTRYRSPGWRMAADITASLRLLDPADPVRYDFALCHLGMLNQCGFERRQRDASCPLRGFCRPAARRQRASRRPSARR